MITVRQANADDIPAISQMLEEMVTFKKRSLPADITFVRDQYVRHPDNLSCALAIAEDSAVLGLQIFKRASAGNPYDVPVGWGIIGTHVHPNAARKGVGRALFKATEKAARDANVGKSEATIGADNVEGLSYYEAVGFRTYETSDTHVRKVLEITAP